MKKELTDYMFMRKENTTLHTPQNLEIHITDTIVTDKVPSTA